MLFQKDLGGFSSWLFGIAHHVVITHYRNKKQVDALDEQSKVDVARPTEEAATRLEQFDRLASLLSTLPEREQEIFSLKYGAQFTNRSIAKIVDLSESNVGTILNRVVSRLREQMENEK